MLGYLLLETSITLIYNGSKFLVSLLLLVEMSKLSLTSCWTITFFQFVDWPTRNANLLDLVFANSPELLLSIDSGFHLQDVGLPSDHYPVIFEIAASVKAELID